VFSLLNDAIKVPIKTYASNSLDNFAMCWFISPTPDSHLDEILLRIENGEGLTAEVFKLLLSSLATSDAQSKAWRSEYD